MSPGLIWPPRFLLSSCIIKNLGELIDQQQFNKEKILCHEKPGMTRLKQRCCYQLVDLIGCFRNFNSPIFLQVNNGSNLTVLFLFCVVINDMVNIYMYNGTCQVQFNNP